MTRLMIRVFAAATAMLGATIAGAVSSDNEVSPRAFHERLAPYGHWFEHPRWGEVWRPTEVPSGFRPYRDGHWENTAAYGTVWVSDYSADADEKGRWGDIVFHYGRWGYDPQYGWLWVPGYTWSPAWVVWREGAGNIGWFPMPPGDYDGAGEYRDDWAGWYGYRGWYGPALTDAAFYGMWSFVPAADIYAPEIGVDIIAPGAYAGFIGRTAGWTRFDVVDGHIVNRSIDPGRFHAAFGRDLPQNTRADFLAHHGVIVGLDRSRHLESVGYGHVHTGYSAGTGFGAVHVHAGIVHTSLPGHSIRIEHHAHPEAGYMQHPMERHTQHQTSGGMSSGVQHVQRPANQEHHPKCPTCK